MEPQPARRRPRADRLVLRQHRSRSGPAPGATSRSSSRTPRRIEQARESGRALVGLGHARDRPGRAAAPASAAPATAVEHLTPPDTPEFRWLMSSDVCKHCTHAGCLDVCPTGALFRTEFGTVVVQADVCNGCGTCVAGCPFGVIERRGDGTVAPTTGHGERKGEQPEVPNGGVAQKCTLCYDRLVDDQTPACAKTCPTTSIKFGDHDDMVRHGPGPRRGAARAGLHRGAALRRQRARRRRRHRVGLPAARRARGLRPAAGPAGAARPTCRPCPSGPRWPRPDMVAAAAVAFVGGAGDDIAFDEVRPPEPARGAGAAGGCVEASGTGRSARRRLARDADGARRSSSPLLRASGGQAPAVG